MEDRYMSLTEEQDAIKEKAFDLLFPFRSEEVARFTTFFLVKEEEVGGHQDTCGSDKCNKESKKQIREYYGKYTRIEERYYDNDGDHENVEKCCICYQPLNEYLTWIKYEWEYFEDLKDEEITLDLVKSNAFELTCILQSFPSNDYNPEGYHIHQKNLGNDDPYNKQIERRTKLINSVIGFCQKIINLFEKESPTK